MRRGLIYLTDDDLRRLLRLPDTVRVVRVGQEIGADDPRPRTAVLIESDTEDSLPEVDDEQEPVPWVQVMAQPELRWRFIQFTKDFKRHDPIAVPPLPAP